MSDVTENAKDKAARLGMVLVEPKPDEIFVDLDAPRLTADFIARLASFLEVYPSTTVEFTRSKGGNIHAYVTCPDVSPLTTEQRIALQAALGSDPIREMIAIRHHRKGYEYTSVFFEVPGSVRQASPPKAEHALTV